MPTNSSESSLVEEAASQQAQALLQQAMAHRKAGAHAEAVACYDRLLTLAPGFARGWFNRGNALMDLQQTAAALASYRRACDLEPEYLDAWFNLGTAHLALHQYAQAVQAFEHIIAHNPRGVDACINKGNAWRGLQDNEQALLSFTQAVRIDPTRAEAHNNVATTLLSLGRETEAAHSFANAVACQPNELLYRMGYAGVLRRIGQHEAALAQYDHAIQLAPHDVEARTSRSLCLLSMGRLQEGFAQYEWRWKSPDLQASYPNYTRPAWDGVEDIRGKRLLVRWEQGLGDMIQFCRYARLLSDRGAHVILRVQPELLRLLTGLHGQGELSAEGTPLPAFDLFTTLLSLPRLLGTDLKSIPTAPHYIRVDASSLKTWRERLGPARRLRIGIAWSGRPQHKNDEHRSMALAEFVQALPDGPEWHVLQKDIRDSDQAALQARADIHCHGDRLHDFSETAALIHEMDWVISVDTSVAHLAGALGKELWLLLPFVPDWRWLLHRDDTPWYPSARLYRQPAMRDWASVLRRIRDEVMSRMVPRDGALNS